MYSYHHNCARNVVPFILTQHKGSTPPISSDLLPGFQPAAVPVRVVAGDGSSSDGSSESGEANDGDAHARAMFGDRVGHQQIVDGSAALPGGAALFCSLILLRCTLF